MNGRDAITYDPLDHSFVAAVEGRDIGRVPSFQEAEGLIEQYYRIEQVQRQVVFPEGRIALKIREVAALFKCEYATIKALIDNGELRAFQMADGGHFRISLRAVEDYIARREEALQDILHPGPSVLSSREYTRHRSA